MIDERINFIIFDIKTIDSIDQFPDNYNYTTTLKYLYREIKSEIFYIAHKIASSKTIGEVKHGSRNILSNIFDSLVKNNDLNISIS